MVDQLWTIGHSTRSLQEFRSLLSAHGMQSLIDVRRFPFSRRYPHFNGEPLAAALHEAGILYTHEPGLGGRRKARADSINLGWKNESFRGYADYMQTEEFQDALQELMADSRLRPTALLCAEAVPWRCHRSLIADALTARGWTIRHILSPDRADLHALTAFARIEHARLSYPHPASDREMPQLF